MSQQDLPFTPHPKKTIEGGFIFFAYVSLVPPNLFPQRKGGFCRRYSHQNAQKRFFCHNHSNQISAKLTLFDNID